MPKYEIISDDLHHYVECSSMEIDNGVLIFYENVTDDTDDGMRVISSPPVKKAFKLWESVEKV